MIHGDFLKLRTKDWRDADVVFMNSTCFDEALMSKVAHLASKQHVYIHTINSDLIRIVMLLKQSVKNIWEL